MKKFFTLWILLTLSSLQGLFKSNILNLNILFVLIGIIPYSGSGERGSGISVLAARRDDDDDDDDIFKTSWKHSHM